MTEKRDSGFWAVFKWQDFRLQIFLEGILVGVFAGILVVAFRYLLEQSGLVRQYIYTLMQTHGTGAIVLWFVVLIVIGQLLSWIVKKEPMARGSGIPEVEGMLAGHVNMNWLRVIIGKFIGGVLAIGAGLSLGREGPSIQLGAAVGQGVSRILKRTWFEEKYLITSGASAGLAGAFHAPLAGVVFALEELHKNFSPAVLVSAMAAALTADLVSQWVFGPESVFNFQHLLLFPLPYYIYLIGLGILCGLFGALFNKTLIKTLDLYDHQRWVKKSWIPVLPLIIAGVLGFVLPETLGGGHELVQTLAHRSFSIKVLLVLLTVKFLFTMISYGSGVPGGIFLPLLVLGALTGSIYGQAMVKIFHVDPRYSTNFVVLAMTAYFTAIVKAPVTGSILITEMTGTLHHLVPLLAVSMTAYLASETLHSKPIYEELLARSLAKRKITLPQAGGEEKIVTEVAVAMGSLLDGKRVKEIPWPADCLLVSIKRGSYELIPKGETKIAGGDYLYLLVDDKNKAKIKALLLTMARESTKSMDKEEFVAGTVC